jgi:aryl-alcohol dehydrogenase-like predicted oxidoreductase
MGMSEFYGPVEDSQSASTIRRALDHGVTFLDTADSYGTDGHNEELVGQAIAGRRDEVVVATKFGFVRNADGSFVGLDGRPEYVRQACDRSLARLRTDHIDLYFQHRVDRRTPIEETVGALAELVDEGKVRFIGLCEASAETLRRAHETHPVSAVQVEYSIWTRDPEAELLPACRELGVGLVAYSPLGRGFLTGRIPSSVRLAGDDFRRTLPRFEEENLRANLEIVERLRPIADAKGCTLSQLAIAWVLAKGSDIVPIPGTKRAGFLDENLGAIKVELTSEDVEQVDRVLPDEGVRGERYPEAAMRTVNR